MGNWSHVNHVKENDLAHGDFINWLKKINIERTEAHRFMKVAKELPNVDNWQLLSNRALYTCPIVGQQSNLITLSDNGSRLPICERTQI